MEQNLLSDQKVLRHSNPLKCDRKGIYYKKYICIWKINDSRNSCAIKSSNFNVFGIYQSSGAKKISKLMCDSGTDYILIMFM